MLTSGCRVMLNNVYTHQYKIIRKIRNNNGAVFFLFDKTLEIKNNKHRMDVCIRITEFIIF